MEKTTTALRARLWPLPSEIDEAGLGARAELPNTNFERVSWNVQFQL